MLEVDSPSRHVSFWTPARRAWSLIWLGFVLWCGLGSAAGYGVTRLVSSNRQTQLAIQVAQPETVWIQRSGMVARQQVQAGEESETLSTGDRLFVAENAAPGVAALVQLGPGEMGLWAKTTLLVEQRGSETQASRMSLVEGQLLIQLPRGAQPLVFQADSSHLITLSAPGRYRLRRLARDVLTTAAAEYGSAGALEVAVAEGEAVSEMVTAAGIVVPGTVVRLPAGERMLLAMSDDGTVKTNRFVTTWPLLRDGEFRDWSEEEYNNTQVTDRIPRADSWRVSLQMQAAPSRGAQNGQFHILEDCGDTVNQNRRCKRVAQFLRTGDNEQSSITKIEQQVNADVVTYKQVMLSADIRIRSHSLSKGGVLGTECPLMIRVFYANHERSGLESNYCFWAFDYPERKGAESASPWIRTYQVTPDVWRKFSVNLKHIPNLLKIEAIEVHANGHDYETLVTDVQLDAIGLSDKQPAELTIRAAQTAGNTRPR